MPPKKKLHELALEVPAGTKIDDSIRKKQYVLGKQFASGGFGRIYTCKEAGSSTELVMKMEPSGNGPLFTEINVFTRIMKPEMIDDYKKQKKISWLGVPYVISTGIFTYKTEKLRFLVLPKYVQPMETILKTGLDDGDVWVIVRSVLNSLEYIHSKNYVHADVKAANIVLEKTGKPETSVLLDYGLARNSSSNEDKPDKKRAHNGTALFTSMDAHRGCHPSYRGDIEILGYNLLFWLTGSLPWQAFEANPNKVYEEKMKFHKDVIGNIDKLIKNENSAKALKKMFALSTTTAYRSHVDHGKLREIVDSVLSGATTTSKATKSRKRPSNTETPDAKRTTTSARKVASSKRKLPSPSVTKRSPRNLGVIPGLTTRCAGRLAMLTKDVEKENSLPSTSETPPVKTKKGTNKSGVSSATKRSPRELRRVVPGMNNLPKGRRSIVIENITKKYKRIARRSNVAAE